VTYVGDDGLAVVHGALEIFDGEGVDVALHGHATESSDAVPNNQVGVNVSCQKGSYTHETHSDRTPFTVVVGQPLVQASWIGSSTRDGDAVGSENHAHGAHGASSRADGIVAASAQGVAF